MRKRLVIVIIVLSLFVVAYASRSIAARFTVNPNRIDPYKNFKFRLLMDGRVVAGVDRISALRKTTEVIRWREGGEASNHEHKAPGRTTYDAITIERGIAQDREFEEWANMVNPFSGDSQMNLADYKKSLVLEFLNEKGQVAHRYILYNCWVSEYTAIAGLEANVKEGEEAIAIERIKIELEGWERDTSVTEPDEG